jgi:hypothetical protein
MSFQTSGGRQKRIDEIPRRLWELDLGALIKDIWQLQEDVGQQAIWVWSLGLYKDHSAISPPGLDGRRDVIGLDSE